MPNNKALHRYLPARVGSIHPRHQEPTRSVKRADTELIKVAAGKAMGRCSTFGLHDSCLDLDLGVVYDLDLRVFPSTLTYGSSTRLAFQLLLVCLLSFPYLCMVPPVFDFHRLHDSWRRGRSSTSRKNIGHDNNNHANNSRGPEFKLSYESLNSNSRTRV